jgi:hypothetical protein
MRTRRTIAREFLAVLGVLFLGFGVWFYSQLELYCFWNPTIDTYFAPRYSEAKFDNLRVGLSKKELLKQIGTPLLEISATWNYAGKEKAGNIWWYSDDHKCKWGDFAWLGRAVVINHGRVTEIIKCTNYD